MTTVHLNAHSTQAADANWQLSPLYLAGMDALRAVCPDADPTPLATTKTRPPADWPSPDPVVRLRFQMRWTTNVQGRCGLNPDEASVTMSPSVTPGSLAALTAQTEKHRAAREARLAEIVRRMEAGESGAAIGRALGLGKNTVLRTLRDVGILPMPASLTADETEETDTADAAAVRWATPHERVRLTERHRQRQAEMRAKADAMVERTHAA